jgi:hypothetical protein
MTKRSIGLMVVLYLFTFGIYPIYWYCKFQNELKKETGEGFTWVGHLLLTIVTFGIYYIVWQYLAGKRLAKLGANDQSIIYVVLCFVFLSWLNPFLMQLQANDLKK